VIQCNYMARETKLSIVVDAQDKTKAAFSAIETGLKKTGSRLSSVTDRMQSIGTTGAIGFAAATAAVVSFVKAGAKFEQTTAAFTTMLGSADKAKTLLKELNAFAASTPFELPELEGASKSLLAFGISAKDIVPTMRKLGDVASGLNIPIGELSEIYGKARVSGRLFAEDINQLTGRGIPIIAELAKQFGVAEGQVKTLVEDGVVGFNNLEVAIESMTAQGGIFFGGMEAQSKTLTGLMSTLSDAFGATSRTIGEQLVPIVKPLIEKLIEVGNAIGSWAAAHPKLTSYIVIAVVAITGLIALMAPLALGIMGVVTVFGTLGTIMGVTSGIAAVSSLGIIAAIAGIGYIAIKIGQIWNAFKNDWDNIWLGLAIIVAEAINGMIGNVESFVNFFVKGFNVVINAINSAISAMSRVPGMKGISSFQISQIQDVKLGRIDTDAIAADQIRRNNEVRGGTTVVIQGNTLLDNQAAEKMGDMLIKQLKLSSAI